MTIEWYLINLNLSNILAYNQRYRLVGRRKCMLELVAHGSTFLMGSGVDHVNVRAINMSRCITPLRRLLQTKVMTSYSLVDAAVRLLSPVRVAQPVDVNSLELDPDKSHVVSLFRCRRWLVDAAHQNANRLFTIQLLFPRICRR